MAPSHPEFGELLEEVRAELGDRDSCIEVVRQGLPRRKIRVGTAFQPYLTERQRTVLKGKPRMSRAWIRILQMLEENEMTMEEFVRHLSVEELVRGEVKDKNGNFRGRPPKWVPREFHRACLRELMGRGKDLWQKNYLAAIEAMTEIATGKGAGATATPGERIRAAQFVIERMEGKVPEKVVLVDDQRWAVVLDGIVAEVTPEAIERGRKALSGAQGVVVEGEVLGEDEDWEDGYPEEEPDPAPVRSRRRR